MLRRALAAVLLASYGLVAAADARAPFGAAERVRKRGGCCCSALAEAPGALIAKLCCSLGCGTQGQDTPTAPSSGDASKLTGRTQQVWSGPIAEESPAVARLAVRLAETSRSELARVLIPLYVANATFLI
jgi:hypothetical protein